jgi:hypothetical protein
MNWDSIPVETVGEGIRRQMVHVRHGATMLEEPVVLIDIFTPIREDFL